ncbi:cryptochrome/photolyase family protein [Enterococcus rivorum]|uniref:Deoxyribodipyrimidine photo-lyase n=1 Tax=Enterococcus rivorum TaxID=762845 RepID=A0A1E5KTA4_9ENTE|nr:deoxyribodipyrimidine photo-lyase [Enterococcus rivorum]MBP2098210.1 deoxyribodipyrimidine photo-lyase [Enterococcus rivorum]OEH80869.1 deoxyribodipyrimidine photolyase [Enterococcus rivorum]
MTSIMWFRRDLRLEDNQALAHALNNSEKLILLFQVNPKQFLENSINQQAFFASVAHFRKKVNQKLHLQILYGEPLDCFNRIKKEIPNWNHIYFNRDECGFGFTRDEAAKIFFRQNEIAVHDFLDAHLHSAQEIKTLSNDFYKVFTPYYRNWLQRPKPQPIKVAMDQKKMVSATLFPEDEKRFSDYLTTLKISPSTSVGQQAAKEKLNQFIAKNLSDYTENRDIPIKNATSHLSRYLRTGEISIRTVWQAVQEAEDSLGKETFQKELCWRDFYTMIYAANPQQKEQPIQKNFSFIQWENNEEQFRQWKDGLTGYPIVDAAMRQLKETGWMHNRLRMIVASFLTKDLLIDWRWGEQYFQQMLVDYDPASNIGGWQWAASTGTDAVPYFRIFNPTTQSKKFDPSGDFIRHYVPELANVPDDLIHQPEKMSAPQQRMTNTLIGKNYPAPIVNHQLARKRAIAAYEMSKDWAKSNYE